MGYNRWGDVGCVRYRIFKLCGGIRFTPSCFPTCTQPILLVHHSSFFHNAHASAVSPTPHLSRSAAAACPTRNLAALPNVLPASSLRPAVHCYCCCPCCLHAPSPRSAAAAVRLLLRAAAVATYCSCCSSLLLLPTATAAATPLAAAASGLAAAPELLLLPVGATLRLAFGLLSVCVHACVHGMCFDDSPPQQALRAVDDVYRWLRGGGGGGSGGGGGGGGRGGGGGGGGGGGRGGGGGGGGGGGRGGAGKGGGRGRSARGVGGHVQQLPRLPDNPTPQQLREWVVQRVSPGGSGRCTYVRRTGKLKRQPCGKLHTEYRCFGRLEDAWVDEYGDEAIVPNWLKLQGMGVDVYALDFVRMNKAIYAMFVTELSNEGACYSCVPGDAAAALGTIESAAALGASESSVVGASESVASTEALHTFTLDSGTSRCFFRDYTTLTPPAAPVPVSLADPTGGPVVARASTVLPCPAVPSGSLSGLHLPTFSTNLVSNAALQDVWVDTFTPRGQRVAICTSLPSLLRSPAPPCLPCVEGRQRTAPHSSKFPPTTAPLQTLHMDVWGPAPVGGMDQERYFLLVVDDYTRYTTVFPLRRKADVSGVLIPWICATRRQLRDRFC
ncbi:unnamed protein product [Closterium sp. NIES-54]